jgi:hypothetical protein
MRFSSGRLAIPDVKVVEVYGGKLNLIIATLCLTTVIDMLVKTESVWTEISGLSESRKLETPVLLSFYINPPVCLASPPQRFSRFFLLPKLTLHNPFKPFNPSTPLRFLPCAC